MNMVHQGVELWEITRDPLILIEKCGRVCYQSEPKEPCRMCGGKFTRGCRQCTALAAEFVRSKIKAGHASILEHASATFYFITDRGMTHEIVRHRIASYSQESTRFVNYGTRSGELSFIEEYPFLQDENMGPMSSEVHASFMEALAAIEHAYMLAIGSGMKPQWARRILPIGMKTSIALTMNFRELRHALALRFQSKAGAAHPQIVKLFGAVLEILRCSPAAPVFEDIQ